MLHIDKIKRNKHCAKACLIVLFGLLTFACTSTAPPPLSLNSIQYVDQSLQDDLLIANVSLKPSESGNMRLNLLLRNDSALPVNLELSTNWYNANFITTEDKTSWQSFTLERYQTKVFESIAVSKDSSHYVVNVRAGGQ